MPQPTTNSFSIKELVKYVRDHAQTGRLLFLEEDQPSAEVFFKRGHFRHAKNKTITGNEVIYRLLDNHTARIRWERNVASPEDSIGPSEESLLLGALGLLPEKGLVRPQTDGLAPSLTIKAARDSHAEIAKTGELPPPGRLDQSLTGTRPGPTPAPPTQPANGATSHNTSGNVHNPLSEIAETSEIGAEQFREQLGDEVLRPPRFRFWTGLPLPFVSAFVFEPEDGMVKTAYDTLWKANFSGFITYVLPQSEGFSLLYQGRIVHSRFADDNTPGYLKDEDALRRITGQQIPSNETSCLLVYPLEPEFVHSFSALLIGEPELNGMSSQSVKLNKLLNTLEQADRTGVVHISSAEEDGYIFLHAGHKLASYYAVEEVLEESILRVYQVVARPDSTIEVLTSPSQDRLFDYASRPRSIREIKLELVELAEEIFGKHSNRVVQLLIQSEESLTALTKCCNQARRVSQLFLDKALADTFYERALLLLQEPG
jgi:hypothetical protein